MADNYLRMAAVLMRDSRSSVDDIIESLRGSKRVARGARANEQRGELWRRLIKERGLTCPTCGSSVVRYNEPLGGPVCHGTDCPARRLDESTNITK